jgi:hypothetical protein
MSPSQKKQPKSAKEYEELGKVVANIYETGYLDRGQSYKMSFIKGMLSGFGGVLGATILIALLLWGLSFFKDAPLVGRFVRQIQHTVKTNQ